MAKRTTSSKSTRTTKATTKSTRAKSAAGSKAAPKAAAPAARKQTPAIKASDAVKAAVAAEANARRQRTATGKPRPVITISREEVAERAYLIWLSKGKPQGQDEANWLEAEAELAMVGAHA
jgi:hypothetical protein